MATPTVSLAKRPAGMSARAAAIAPLKAATHAALKAGFNFTLGVGGDSGVTIGVADSAGNLLDVSGLVTMTAVSADPSQVTVDVPVGLTFNEHPVAATPPGAPCNVTITVTWNDGSFGPFAITDPISVTGPPTGLVISHGPPTLTTP